MQVFARQKPDEPCSETTNLEQKLRSLNDHIRVSYSVGDLPELDDKVRSGACVIARIVVYKSYSVGLSFGKNSLFPCDVLINQKDLRGPAQHNDVVAVELLPEDEWQAIGQVTDDGETVQKEVKTKLRSITLPDGRCIQQCLTKRKDNNPFAALPAEVRLSKEIGCPDKYDWPSDVRPIGKVIHILYRDINAFHVGAVADGVMQAGEFVSRTRWYRFQLYDPRMPQVVVDGVDIPAQLWGDLSNYIVLLKLVATPEGDLCIAKGDMLRATVSLSIGSIGRVSTHTLSVYRTYGLPSVNFPEEVEECVPAVFCIPSEDELARTGRRDLRRSEIVISIDPETARDLDDAVSIEKTPTGFHVGVHIADVSHFVTPGTAVDEEAQKRMTSVYMVHQAITMLPRSLTEDYCSLNPGEDKLAMSILFELDREGNVISEWIGRTVIRNICRLSYEEAERMIQNETVDVVISDPNVNTLTEKEVMSRRVHTSVRIMHHVASKMRNRALARGRFTVGSRKVGFTFPNSDCERCPSGFYLRDQISAEWLVEQFMLLANSRVAEKIVQYLPEEALLRRHLPLNEDRRPRVKQAAEAANLRFLGTSAKELTALLDSAKGTPLDYPLRRALLCSLPEAEYIPNGVVVGNEYSHFGLGLPWYTHFTSPIRRYCDIIVHRQLLIALEVEQRLKSACMVLPSVADPSIEPKLGSVPFRIENTIDIESLETRNLYTSLADLETICIKANSAKLNARVASMAHIKGYLCIYLMAVRRTLPTSERIPWELCTVAYVTHLTNGVMHLYSPEIEQSFEIGYKDNSQQFTTSPIGISCSSADAPPSSDKKPLSYNGTQGKVNEKLKSYLRKKGGKNDMPTGQTDAKSSPKSTPYIHNNPVSIWLTWTELDSAGEPVSELISMFSKLVVALEVKCVAGNLSLAATVLPPSQRKEYYRSGVTIPTKL